LYYFSLLKNGPLVAVIPACLREAASAKAGENRNPDVVPTKVGNHVQTWVPVFTGNPGFLLPQE
jgi:hypothetical protein